MAVKLTIDGKPIEVPMPVYGPDELLVRHDACGICFSDIKVIRQGQEAQLSIEQAAGFFDNHFQHPVEVEQLRDFLTNLIQRVRLAAEACQIARSKRADQARRMKVEPVAEELPRDVDQVAFPQRAVACPMNPWKSGAVFSPTLRPYSVNCLARSA